jgi:hypothetical protein
VGSRGGLELRRQLGGTLPAVGRPLLQAAHDRGRERGRAGGAQAAERLRLLGDLCGQHCLRSGRRERRPPGKHLVGEHAHRVDVGPVVNVRIGRRLLRRHVGGRPECHAERRERRSAGALVRVPTLQRLGHAEVGDDGMSVGEQDVVRFNVAVHHAVAVGVRERVHHLTEDPGSIGHRKLPLARELHPERLALDKRHHVVQEVAGGAGRQQRDDVRVLQTRRELNFPLEALGAHASTHFRRKHLDDDLAAQARLFGEEDAAHPPAAELAPDAVGVADSRLDLRLESDGSDRVSGDPKATRGGAARPPAQRAVRWSEGDRLAETGVPVRSAENPPERGERRLARAMARGDQVQAESVLKP